MALSKTTSTNTTSMLHTAVIIMVQPLVEGMTCTWQTMQVTIIILASIATPTRVPTATIGSGLAHLVSAQMSWRSTMKRLRKREYP